MKIKTPPIRPNSLSIAIAYALYGPQGISSLAMLAAYLAK